MINVKVEGVYTARHKGKSGMEFEVKITEAFLKKSHFRRLFRNWWKLCIAFLMIMVAITFDLKSGEIGRISVSGITIIGFCVIIYSVVWTRQTRSIRDWTERQKDKPVRYWLTEESIESESAFGSTKLKWDVFKRLSIRPLDTLLEFPRAGALALPTSQLRSEVLDFMAERFSAHGKMAKSFGYKNALKSGVDLE